MRKLKLQVQMSMNGYVCGPNYEMDWMTWEWDDKLKDFVKDLHQPVDCILLGRKMAKGFMDHWENSLTQPDANWMNHKMVDTRKVIFSRNGTQVDGKNAEMAKGDMKEAVNNLKNESGQDIIVYGGAEFVSELLREKLIDELYLFINPASIESGMTIFRHRGNYKLENATAYDCGISVLKYSPVKA